MRAGPRKVVALNNGDEIKRIQELEENKRLLAAQREMYSTAKRFDCANALVCFAGRFSSRSFSLSPLFRPAR